MKARVSDAGNILGRSRFVLICGFGGLLILLVLLGVDAIGAVTTMQIRNTLIQREYLSRSSALSQIRSGLYLAGTHIRDYVSDPDPSRARKAAADLARLREHMQEALRKYAADTASDLLVKRLQNELEEYWRMVEPSLRWSVEQRHREGYLLVREVLPRRILMLGLTDEIAAGNVARLAEGNERVQRSFQEFRKRLIALLCMCVAMGLLLAGFASRRLLRLERQAADRYDEVAAARSELQDLSARLLEAQETERRAISRELHDEIGQTLSALLVGLGNLAAALPERVRDQLTEQIVRLRGAAESSLSAIRNMCLLLRPSMLDDLGLVAALQWHAREVTRNTGILVTIAADSIGEEALSDEHKTCIYRITQEALHNACRHASPQNVRITVRERRLALSVRVQDDGCGFDPAQHRGLGIIGMQERVARLGGTFDVKSEMNGGTVVAVTLPLSQNASAASAM